MQKTIGIVGDFHKSETQVAIAESIEHANKLLGYSTKYHWIETTELSGSDYPHALKNLNGIWSATGCPFKSMEGALNAIKYARETKVPHIGTCSGYQHSIIEYARNVVGIKNANHEEYTSDKNDLVINKMACSLKGTRGKVMLEPSSLTAKIFGTSEIEVDYYCSYGLNSEYEEAVLKNGFVATGFDVNGAVRLIEMKNHPFYIITAFVPQVDSSFDKPNKLVLEFVKQVCNG